MAAIAILSAICAAAVLFLGYFFVALCKDCRNCHVVGYLLRIESDTSCGKDERPRARYHARASAEVAMFNQQERGSEHENQARWSERKAQLVFAVPLHGRVGTADGLQRSQRRRLGSRKGLRRTGSDV